MNQTRYLRAPDRASSPGLNIRHRNHKVTGVALHPPVLRTRTSHQPPRARHQAPRPDQATEDPGARHPRAGERRTPETRCASSKRTPNSPGAAPAAPRNQNPPAGFQPGRNTPNTPRGPVARTPRISRDQSPRKPGPPDRRGVFSLQSHM